MHLILDLGQLCAAKMRGQDSPAFIVRNIKTNKDQARISCVSVAANGVKRGVVICMEPLVLRSYQAVHGSVKSGDPLHILPTDFDIEIERRSFGSDKPYFVITTDTLSRARLAHQAAKPAEKEESEQAA